MMKTCPYCAEEIAEEAIRCRWCDSDLTVRADQIIASPPSSLVSPRQIRNADRQTSAEVQSIDEQRGSSTDLEEKEALEAKEGERVEAEPQSRGAQQAIIVPVAQQAAIPTPPPPPQPVGPSTVPPAGGSHTTVVQVATSGSVVLAPMKSVGVALVLTFFFGPLGLLYSSIAGGIILTILALIIGPLTLGVALFPIWIGSMIWGAVAASSHNKKLLHAQQPPAPMQASVGGAGPRPTDAWVAAGGPASASPQLPGEASGVGGAQRFCGFCGASNPANHRFCGSCGRELG